MPWLAFQQITSKSSKTRALNRLEALRQKEIHLPTAVDWGWMGNVGLEEELTPYLVKDCNLGYANITCDGWLQLFKIQEPVYAELCWEFFATISFRGGSEYYNPNTISFSLGGEMRQCSMVEFSWRLGIYDQDMSMTDYFEAFLENTYKELPEGVVASTWWSTIANRVYIPSTAQEGHIRSPIHRLIHRFIASTINMRKDGDKVPTLDIFYMWSIITPDVFCDLPYCIAKFLAEGAVKEKINSKINGGMFITRLARSFGILELPQAQMLTVIHPPPFNTALYRRARIVEKFGDSFTIPNEDEPAVPEEPGRRVRPRNERVREDPPVIPVEDNEGWNQVEYRRYLDDIGRGVNYTNQSFDYLFQQMHIAPRPGPGYPYIMNWDERMQRRGGEGGSGAGGAGMDEEE